jgi:hypothetical protein
MKTPTVHERDDDPREPDANRGKPGSEGDSDAARKPPPVPDADDDSPLGDTDQHSDADA